MSAASLVAGLLRQHAERAGANVAVNGEAVHGGALAVTVTGIAGDAVLIERAAHSTEGRPLTRRARMRVVDPVRTDALIGAAINWIARLQRREIELGVLEPAWSFSVSTATMCAMRHLGLNPASMARPGPTAAWGRSVANAAGAGVDVRLVGSRMSAQSIVIPATGRAPAIHLDETIGLPTLTIMMPLPDTLVVGCVGRQLGEVIEHPAMSPDLVILAMSQLPLGAPEVRLIVEDVREAAATPPGACPEWLGVGERSRDRPLFT